MRFAYWIDFHCRRCGTLAGSVRMLPATREQPAEPEQDPPDMCPECRSEDLESSPGDEPEREYEPDDWDDRAPDW